MKIPVPIVCLFLLTWLGVNGWTAREVIGLKAEVAALSAKMQMHIGDPNQLASLP